MIRTTLLLGALTWAMVACARVPAPVAPHRMNSTSRAPLDVPTGKSITSQSEAPPEEPAKPTFERKPNPFDEEEEANPCVIDYRALVADELVAYITAFMSPIRFSKQYQRRYPRALAIIPALLDLVELDMARHPLGHLDPLDPLLIAVTIAYESSWDHEVVGDLGERGYMQVHGDIARGGFTDEELDHPKNQLLAGIRHLRRAIDRCPGDLRGALTMYGTGDRCRPYAPFVKWRWRAYQKALRTFREEKTHESKCKTKGVGAF